MVKTMKKSLAFLLVLAMSLSMLCVPAMAAFDTIPYFFNDFETGYKSVYGPDMTQVVLADTGAGGSAKSLKITDTGAGYTDRVIVDMVGAAFSGEVSGSVLRISFYIKIPQALSNGTVMFLVGTDAGTIYPGASFDKTNTTDWQKVSVTANLPEGTTKINSIKFRFGGHGTTTDLVDGDTTGLARDFYIDDFAIEVLNAAKADSIANLDGYYASYEGDVAPLGIYQAGYWNATKTLRDNGALSGQVVANPDGSGQAVKITMSDTAGHGNELYIANNINTGTYSAGYVPAGTVPAGSTVTLRFKYYLETPLDSNVAFGFSCQLYGGSGYYLTGTDFDSTPNQWNIATLTYTNNTESDIEMPDGVKLMLMRAAISYVGGPTWQAATLAEGETKYGERTVYFDDMEMFVTAEGEAVPAVEKSSTSENLIVVNDVTTGSEVSFVHTFSPATGSAQDVTDTSIVRLMNVTASGETASLACCKISSKMTIPAIPADSVSMYFEVVPIGSDGVIGDAKKYPAVKSTVTEKSTGNAFPYMLYTFEDGKNFVNNSAATIVEGGMGGSGHAVQIAAATGADHTLITKDAKSYSTTIPANNILRISFWVKLSAAQESAKFALINYSLGGYLTEASVPNPSSTDWQKVIIDYTPSSDATLGNSYLRTVNIAQNILIDDVEVAIVDKDAEKIQDQIAKLDGYRMNFESGASMCLMISDVGYPRPTLEAVTNGSETLQIVPNPDGEGMVLKMDLTDTQPGGGSMSFRTAKAGGTNYPGYPEATVPAGGTITYSFKYYFSREMASDNTPGFCMYHASGEGLTEKYMITYDIDTSANKWNTATISWTNDTEEDVKLRHYSFRCCAVNADMSIKAATLSEGETKYGNRSIYLDDVKVDVIPKEGKATGPVSAGLETIGQVAAGNDVWFIHDFEAASTSTDAEDASAISLVSYNEAGKRNILKSVALSGGMNIPAIPADCKKLAFEVVPMSTDGKVGNPTEYVVWEEEEPEIPVITETALEYVDGQVKVSAAEAINGAYIIFVSYDANNKMVDYDMSTTVTLAAQQSGNFAPAADFVSGTTTKAMLWADMTSLMPIATAITY